MKPSKYKHNKLSVKNRTYFEYYVMRCVGSRASLEFELFVMRCVGSRVCFEFDYYVMRCVGSRVGFKL